jgi:two-component system, sensor histidine kinase and response regulator
MKRILVVEDEFDVQINLKELLESESYEVITANDGEMGYQLAVEKQPDLIISDIKMPLVDGFALFKMLQENGETDTIPFIFLTAKVETSDFREGMSLGVDDYLTKPYRIDDVLRAIEIRLKKKETQFENLNQLKESMLRRIPHELRTPLVGIIGFSQLIEENVEDLTRDEVKEMVNKINSSGKRLQRRIEKFLYYAELLAEEKSENILVEIRKSIYQIDQKILTHRLSLLLNDFDRINDLELDITEARLNIDERYYEIIIRELLENALKFSTRGSKIKIKGELNDRFYKTRIEDAGYGMSDIALKHINALNQFAPDKYLEEGVGLGLAMVQKIIAITGGYMKVRSKLNEYTIVEFDIPTEE